MGFGDLGSSEVPQTRRAGDTRACGFGAGEEDEDEDEDEGDEDESEDVPAERFDMQRSEEKRFPPRAPPTNIPDLAEAEPSGDLAGLALIPIVSRRGGEEAQAPR